jgi:hypothetical protein
MDFYNQYQDGSNWVEIRLFSDSSGSYTWLWRWQDAGTSYNIACYSPGLSINTWYHIALARSGNTWYWFQNGMLCGTAIQSHAVADLAGPLVIGGFPSWGEYWLNGSLDEFRVTKGLARWTSAFTPPVVSALVTDPAVTVTLLDSNGNGLSGGAVQYYSGGWFSFGTTGSDGTVRMSLAAGTYTFQITYAGASLQKIQDVGTNLTVTFQTVKVHSEGGTCTSYIAGSASYNAAGWQTFTQDMQLLPGAYTFRFSDKTLNTPDLRTTDTIVAGIVTHIH